MDVSEDRLRNLPCGEQACNAFRSLNEKIQILCNVCVRGMFVFLCFFQSSSTLANQVACF